MSMRQQTNPEISSLAAAHAPQYRYSCSATTGILFLTAREGREVAVVNPDFVADG